MDAPGQNRPFLAIYLVYRDVDFEKLVVSAAASGFAGQTTILVAPGTIAELADKLDGFPKGTSDERNFDVGSFGLEWAGGAAAFLFMRTDSAGHASVELRIEEDSRNNQRAPASAFFRIPVLPAAIDEFVSQLPVAANGEGEAVL